MRSSVAMRATLSAMARSVNACIRRSGSFTWAEETQQRKKKGKIVRIAWTPHKWGRTPVLRPTSTSASGSWRTRAGVESRPTRLLACWRSAAVGAVLLAMQVTGMRRRMERETVEQRHVVGVHAVAQLIVRRYVEPRHEHARGRAQPDIHHVIARPAPAEGPSGIVSAEWTQTALLRVGNPWNRQVDAGDVRHEHT